MYPWQLSKLYVDHLVWLKETSNWIRKEQSSIFKLTIEPERANVPVSLGSR